MINYFFKFKTALYGMRWVFAMNKIFQKNFTKTSTTNSFFWSHFAQIWVFLFVKHGIDKFYAYKHSK